MFQSLYILRTLMNSGYFVAYTCWICFNGILASNHQYMVGYDVCIIC